MAGIVHVGVGFAAKPLAPKAPLWGLFYLIGLESFADAPYSHGLLMASVWSFLSGLVSARIFRSTRTGVVIGLTVFSHWVIDFITHPMTPGSAPDLPLLLAGSPKVGLGLYGMTPQMALAIIEIGSVLAGIAVYGLTRKSAMALLSQRHR